MTRLPSPVGVVLLATAAALIALGIVQTDTWGWLDARTRAAMRGGLALLGGFLLHQRWTSSPVLDLDLFQSHNYRWVNIATLVFSTGFIAMFFASILFLSSVWRWSIFEAGLGVSPGPLLVAALAPFLGRLAARTGQRPLLILGSLLFACGGLWRLLFLGESPDYVADYLPSMLMTGTGVALCIPQLASAAAQSIAPNRLGVGAAVNQATRQLGSTLGVALAIALIGEPASIAEAVTNYDHIWWLLIACGLATALLVLPLQTTQSRA
jgi:MFS family permease